MSEGLYVLSLFDGISGGQLALKKAGIKVAKYYASEIEKQPIWITRKNFPNTVHLGDVNNFMQWDIDWDKIDLLIGGSPCQNLSAAGNGKGLAGEQSKLFFKYLEILGWLKQINPNVKFLLENVASMTKDNKELITKYLKEKEPNTDVIMIDSALLSAQRRKRLYWHNFGKEIPQPKDKGIVLKDVLESGYGIAVEDKGKKINRTQNKSSCLMAIDYKGFGNQQMTGVAEPIKEENITNYFRNFGSKGKILLDQQKSSALTAAMGAGGGNIPLIANKAVIMFESINETNYKDQFKQTSEEPKENSKDTARIGNIGSNAQAHRVYSVRGKSVNLSSQSGGQGAKTGLYKIDLPDGDILFVN